MMLQYINHGVLTCEDMRNMTPADDYFWELFWGGFFILLFLCGVASYHLNK